MRRSIHAINATVVVGILLEIHSLQAQEQALYGIAHKPTEGVNEHDIVFKYDLETGEETVLGPLGFDLTSSGAGFSADGTFWGFGHLVDERLALFTADLSDGHGTIVQMFGFEQFPACCPIGFECGPDGEFYVMNGTQLLVLDVENATARTIARTSFWSNNLTATPDCSGFYTGVGRIVRIDSTDWSETVVASNLSGVDGGLALAPDGRLYSGNLHVVDLIAQTTTRIGSLGLSGVGGLAFGPERFICGGMTSFLRGDCNGAGTVDISDAVFSLRALFIGDHQPRCDDACDSNDDGTVDVSDAINTLHVLFLGKGLIPLPGMAECGVDPTSDSLDCRSHESCSSGDHLAE